MRIHFGSGGNYLHFYLGIAASFQKNNFNITHLSGVSAGTFAASFLAYDLDINRLYYSWNYNLCKNINKTEKIIDSFYQASFPLFENRHAKYNLDIWTSKINVPYITSHKFCGKFDLFEKIACSCYIPIFCPNKTLLYKYKDDYFIDGVLTFDKEKDYQFVINYKDYIKEKNIFFIKLLDKFPSCDIEKNERLFELGKESFNLRLIE